MLNLKQLRLRIKSVKSTKKITKAMQMISAAKLRKAKLRLENARYYYDSVKQNLEKAVISSAELSSLAKSMMQMEHNSSKPKLTIAFTADRGLCGGFNQTVIRLVKTSLLSATETKIVAVGKRMMNFINTSYPDNLVAEYTCLEMKDDVIGEIVDSIILMIRDNSISACELCFNFFKNALTQIPTQKQIVPLVIDAQPDKSELVGDDVLNKLLRIYIISEIRYALLQSLASEEASRTTAMDNATRNAGELIDDLTLAMNRQRQAAITKELTEIISGAEAV